MTGEPTTTIIGNLTADPEMRYTASGAAVASFTIASTPRTFNRQTNQWQDGQTLFMRCQVWRDAAQNAAASLTKGTRVIATGRLQQRSYTDREGAQRTVIEMQVDEIGPSLRYSTAQITDRRAGAPGSQSTQGQGSQAGPGVPWEPQAPTDDPDYDGWAQR
mgnify:FL=1